MTETTCSVHQFITGETYLSCVGKSKDREKTLGVVVKKTGEH